MHRFIMWRLFALLALVLPSITHAQLVGGEQAAVCFAPGTPAWRVELTTAFARGTTGLGGSGGLGGLPGKFQGLPGTRWSSTATDGGGLGQGDPTVITWSYVPDGTTVIGGQVPGEPTAPSNLQSWLGGIYGNFNIWHALFVQVFDNWSELTGISYVYEPNDDGVTLPSLAGTLGVRGDVRISAHFIDGSPAGGSVLGYNYFPNGGDMVLDSADTFFNSTTNNSIRLRNTVSHEHGHGVGMRHVCPINQSKLMEPFLTTSFDGLQHDDTLGGQRGYGDTDEPNDTSGTATALAGTEVTVSDRGIDDNGDVDWYAFPGASGEVITVTLDPVGFTYLEGPQNANGSCPAGTSFNSIDESDLALEVRDTNATTVLASANASGAGGSESIANLALPSSGTFFVRITGAQNAAQLYALTLEGSGTIFADGFESGNTSAWSSTVP